MNKNSRIHTRLARLLVASALVTAGSAMAADVINVNYAGNPAAYMQGVWSYDAAARGTASRVAPLEYLGNTWNDFNNPTATATNLSSSATGHETRRSCVWSNSNCSRGKSNRVVEV